MKTLHITVPATSANLGPGFDSVGLALNKYLTLTCRPAEQWRFVIPDVDQPFIPADGTNLIYRIALHTAHAFGKDDLPPYEVTVINEVPIARGLGSSSTAVVAGIELADQIHGLALSKEDKLRFACDIEGHPDNVAPAIYGGVMVSSYDNEHLDFVRFSKGLTDLTWVAVIPDFHLETQKARAFLPSELSYPHAIHASANANVLVAALAEQDWPLVGKMMERDLWHQPYRKALIPHFEAITHAVKQTGGLGTYMSGAGPTLIGLFEGLDNDQFKRLRDAAPGLSVEALSIDLSGVQSSVTDTNMLREGEV
ncbi:homoserine kinase [Thalassobacillus sp. CUG 92003]|uniref:homoserine kinase n=1 Tax=Thalassobacillus sp. CUG 92003 TaxID=2736641 RepID=UPI0015E75ABE|nr:homoserine kinase [Thalassobacillus sp. CUG 92003]